jgi:hypothetical protein
MELIAITVWRDVDALIRVLGDGWESPRWLADVDDLITNSTVEHWETAVEAFDPMDAVALGAPMPVIAGPEG